MKTVEYVKTATVMKTVIVMKSETVIKTVIVMRYKKNCKANEIARLTNREKIYRQQRNAEID